MRIGIDLGGTKTEVIALGVQGSSCTAIVCPRRVMITGRLLKRSPRWLIWRSRQQGSGTVGMGIPGSISPYTGVVKNANSTRSTVSHSIKT